MTDEIPPDGPAPEIAQAPAALDQVVHRDGDCSIAEVLAHYHAKVTKHLSVAMMEADQFPQEILNEIRGAFTHLAKANSFEAGSQLYHAETRSAMRHLKRASLDSLKIAVMATAERLEHRILVLSETVRLPHTLYATTETLRDERLRLLNSESSHPSIGLVDDIERLYLSYEGLAKQLRNEYDGAYAEVHTKRAKRAEDRAAFRGFVFGIPAGIVASAAWLLITSLIEKLVK